MSIACFFGRHSPLPIEAVNQGFQFSQCKKCGCDMIRTRGAWRSVPKGFRVVWRRVDEPSVAALPLRIVSNLPVLARHGLRRQLELIAIRLSATAELGAAALRLAGWGVAARARALHQALMDSLRPRQLVLPLPLP